MLRADACLTRLALHSRAASRPPSVLLRAGQWRRALSNQNLAVSSAAPSDAGTLDTVQAQMLALTRSHAAAEQSAAEDNAPSGAVAEMPSNTPAELSYDNMPIEQISTHWAAMQQQMTAPELQADVEDPALRLLRREIELEERAVSQARLDAMATVGTLASKRLLGEVVLANKLEAQWSAALTHAIEEEQRLCLSREGGAGGADRRVYGGYLLMLEPEVLARVTIRETLALTLGPEGGAVLSRLLRDIGSAVEAQVAARLSNPERRARTLSKVAALQGQGGSQLKARARTAMSQAVEREWPVVVQVKIGAVLLRLLMRSAMVHVEAGSSGALVEESGIAGLPPPAPPGAAGKHPQAPLQLLHSAMKGAAFYPDAAPGTSGGAGGGVTAPPAALAAAARTPFVSSAADMAGGESLLDDVVDDSLVDADGGSSGAGGVSCGAAAGGAGGEGGDAPWSHLGMRGSVGPGSKGKGRAAVAAALHSDLEIDADMVEVLSGSKSKRRKNAKDAAAAAAATTTGDAVTAPAADAAEAAASAATATAAVVEEEVDALPSPQQAKFAQLAALAASRVQKRVVKLPDGRQVTVVPAFVHDYVWTRNPSGHGSVLAGSSLDRDTASRDANDGLRYFGFVFSHPRLLQLLSARAALMSHVAYPPMVVQPLDWKGFHSGAYLLPQSRVPLMRMITGNRFAVSMTNSMIRTGGMDAVLDGLNTLGKTPWRLNPFIHDTMKRVWGDGKAGDPAQPRIPDFPPFEADDPEDPAPLDKAALAAMPAEQRQAAKAAWGREWRRRLQKRGDNLSLRRDFELKMAVADEHIGDEVIYFPHNMDFRGRVYPIPPHLNHMGSDLARGLLQFGQSKPLGDRGTYWLMVHLANLMGKDKISFDDRVAYVEANIREVVASAQAPLAEGGRWWLKADKPWQALAVCRELAAAMALPQHSRHAYECAVPVHQDGSCNGLQHYAALGRDEEGGRAVNLLATPANKPADVYSRVLQLVVARIESDCTLAVEASLPNGEGADRARRDTRVFALKQAERMFALDAGVDGDDDGGAAADFRLQTLPLRKMAAQFLKGSVDRKVVKQTVMTSVYGVTFMGAREQVLARLRERFPDPATGAMPRLPDGREMTREELEYMLQASAQYLARTTLNSLGDLFSAADAIKGWLSEVARLVAAREQPMSWITPLGLPCVQPYRQLQTHVVKTVLQDLTVTADDERLLRVSRPRQRTAFPPNFIHSLDSSHMLLTALACKRESILFTAVHDSFWTHPSDVDRMRDLLRAEFVNLYSRPVLEDFRTSLLLRFPGLAIPQLPPRGTLDLRSVLDAPYFFN